jgi:isopentenyl diphosphate isomerase/L-lactate dehydrogenase-like FMN-dependent dehydrogenase
MGNPANWRTLQEVAREAHASVTPGVWNYIEGGAESETSMRRNRLALDSIAFKPRVLRNVAKIDTSATFLGHKLRLPLVIAPCGSVFDINPGGTMAIAKAAEAFGVCSFLSGSSPTPPELEDIARETRHPKVFQLSVKGDPAEHDARIRRAIDAGYAAVGFTLDAVVHGRRERDLVSGHVPHARRMMEASAAKGHVHAPAFTMTWDHIKRFKDTFRIPLVLKAIVTAADAALACEHGVDVVYISNHGGRQLDYSRATIDVVAEVVHAVGGRAQVVVDGGFLRGSDILKAIALGADVVAVGRLMCLGLAAGGQAGIVRTFEIVEEEVRVAMGLLGVTSMAELDTNYIDRGHPAGPPGTWTAYPLLQAMIDR